MVFFSIVNDAQKLFAAKSAFLLMRILQISLEFFKITKEFYTEISADTMKK